MKRNKNRGYRQLRVWPEAVEFHAPTSQTFRGFPHEQKRIASQAMASSDSVHGNIAEGHGRRSIREYLNFLNIAPASLGESVSGCHAYRKAGQISGKEFECSDALAFKLENGLLKLAESLERKQDKGDWIDNLIVEESNRTYNQPWFTTPCLHL